MEHIIEVRHGQYAEGEAPEVSRTEIKCHEKLVGSESVIDIVLSVLEQVNDIHGLHIEARVLPPERKLVRCLLSEIPERFFKAHLFAVKGGEYPSLEVAVEKGALYPIGLEFECATLHSIKKRLYHYKAIAYDTSTCLGWAGDVDLLLEVNGTYYCVESLLGNAPESIDVKA